MQASFLKTVSRGTRFSQIYIPKEMENKIEAGDLVEVRLVKKREEIYLKNVQHLSEFKKYLIKNIFTELQKFSEIKSIFIVGSFLQETIYNDVDIALIVGNAKKDFDNDTEQILSEKFSQKFHVISFTEDKLNKLLEIDPLTRVMFGSFASNKKISFSNKKSIDENHLKFLLMMPEDLLDVKLSSRTFYDSLRRLISIEYFLADKKADIIKINEDASKLIDLNLLAKIKNNEDINNKELAQIREIIRKKLAIIDGLIKNGKKG